MGAVRSEPFASRGWVRRGIAIAIALNLTGAAGAAFVVGAGADDLTVDEAVRRFRENEPAPASASTTEPTSPTAGATATPTDTARRTKAGKRSVSTAAPEPSSRRPIEGVYVYSTEGYEETDALSGQRHDYPSETTITITRHGCGWRWRWQPLEERWDESDVCRTAAGVVLDRFAIYHEFFRQSAVEDFACGDDAVVMPDEPVAGASWRWKGHSNDTFIDTITSVVGFETIAVGSGRVDTVHIRYETAMSGDNDGTQIQDRWLAADTGLLVRMINAADAKVETPFGGQANYTERYRIDLTSTKPVA